jgi:hypothetical protein
MCCQTGCKKGSNLLCPYGMTGVLIYFLSRRFVSDILIGRPVSSFSQAAELESEEDMDDRSRRVRALIINASSRVSNAY